MKKYKIAYITMITFLALGACKDKLDEFVPQQDISNELAFSDRATAIGSLMGVYSLLQDLEAQGSMPQMISEYMADNVNFVGSFPTLQDINDYTTLSDNSSVQGIWRDNYEPILAANAVIANVPDVADVTFTNEEKLQVVAEARFLRALTYFQLVNLFGQPFQVNNGNELGVPLVLEPFTGEILYPSRVTVQEVHTQIIADLENAVANLPASYDDAVSTRGRATQGAARALLSRIYLYRGEWQDAADYANQVIGSSIYALASDYNFYNGNTPEDVFTIQNTATDNGRTGSGFWTEYYNPADIGGRGDAPFSANLLAAFNEESGDLRLSSLTQTGSDAASNNSTFTSKFPDAVNNADNAPVIRTTEMYLNRAEALAELNGINAESINLINALRSRAGLGDWVASDFASAGEFLDAIANERRKELCFEGHRRMDLLRRGNGLRPVGDANFTEASFGANRTIFPIPQREMDLNTNLVQNTGY